MKKVLGAVLVFLLVVSAAPIGAQTTAVTLEWDYFFNGTIPTDVAGWNLYYHKGDGVWLPWGASPTFPFTGKSASDSYRGMITVPIPPAGSPDVTWRLMLKTRDKSTPPVESEQSNIIQYTVKASCIYVIAPSSSTVTFRGGILKVVVTAGSECVWTAISGVPWVTITAGGSGSGTGEVTMSVGVNPNMTPRSGIVTIAGHEFTINQGEKLIPGPPQNIRVVPSSS